MEEEKLSICNMVILFALYLLPEMHKTNRAMPKENLLLNSFSLL